MHVRLLGRGDCEVTHEGSGVLLRTAKSHEFGGTGSSFSSTDLLAAALATCIATDIEPVAQRAGIPLDAIRVTARKHVTLTPKRVEALDVEVTLAVPVEQTTLLKLRRAADACLVQRSLSPAVACRIHIAAI